MGRFSSPDPGWFFASRLENPQTWDQYSYVLNNPLNATDPDGYDCVYGVKRCVAVATEPLGDKLSCFELRPTEEDLDLFNQECGLFRFMLTSEDRSWAISCTESYNLFAAKPDLLVALLGAPIEQARGEFLGFVSTPSIDPQGLLREMALRYGVL